jgi:hypothetical protein
MSEKIEIVITPNKLAELIKREYDRLVSDDVYWQRIQSLDCANEKLKRACLRLYRENCELKTKQSEPDEPRTVWKDYLYFVEDDDNPDELTLVSESKVYGECKYCKGYILEPGRDVCGRCIVRWIEDMRNGAA